MSSKRGGPLAGLVGFLLVATACAGSAADTAAPEAPPPRPAPVEECADGTPSTAGVRCPDEDGHDVEPAPSPTAPEPVTGPPVVTVPPTPYPPADPARPARVVTPDEDVPNPFVLVEDDSYFLYASQIGIYDPAIQVRVSDRIDQWGPPLNALLQGVPAWVDAGFTWAPDVRRIGDRYLMYFTARLADTDKQCIGLAVADNPLGPFVGDPEPMICQLDRGGSIDARSLLEPDGSLWLHWKSDDNSDVEGTATSSIYAQRLSADGLALTGEPVPILEVDQLWEGRIVEAPHMLLDAQGRYWLWYSANWFNQPDYAIGVARCDGPAGPCHKPFTGPWLASNAQGDGPGESSHFVDRDGSVWMVYAPQAQRFETQTDRPVALARVAFDEAGPYPAAP